MTKIDIISGFLGAGKTTFIKKMIDEVFTGEKLVLIENEFGEVGIDGGFLKDAGIQITEMNSGCICCSLVGDFGRNLHEVIGKYHPDRILIEPSGVGKLSDVMKSVIDVEKEEDVKLNGLITVVNALKASKQMKAFGEFFNNQIEYATTVVLSRSQNATPEQLELCVKQIQSINDKAAIITTPWDSIRGEQILKVVEGQDSLERKLSSMRRKKPRSMSTSIITTMTSMTMSITMTTTIMIMSIITTMTSMTTRITIMSIITIMTSMTMRITIMSITTTTTSMTMSIITSTARTVPAAATITIMSITIIMRMRCLQAGEKRRRISLPRQRLRMS